MVMEIDQTPGGLRKSKVTVALWLFNKIMEKNDTQEKEHGFHVGNTVEVMGCVRK